MSEPTTTETTSITNWLAGIFFDEHKEGGYIAAELDRRLPNRSCSIGIATSHNISLINRSSRPINNMVEMFQGVRVKLDNSNESIIGHSEGSEGEASYGIRIPPIPGRDLTALYLAGPTDAVQEDLMAIQEVLTEVGRRIEENAQSVQDTAEGAAEDGI